MSYASARAAIEAHWACQWVVPNSGEDRTPTAYEAAPFEPPESSPWARLRIVDGSVRQISIGAPGANKHRHPGVIMLSLFVPNGRGTQDLRALMDEAAAVFRNVSIENVRCWEASALVNGPDGPWLQGTVRWEFWRDEHF